MFYILLMIASSTHWLMHQTRQNKSICLNNSLKRNSIPKMALSSPLLWYPFLAMIMASTLLEVEVFRVCQPSLYLLLSNLA
ncbi:unnamed protein product, partial [Vitis vinifera]|uniref:Uncharacterized protein n=1 Tax=Vitis vinifera TaxID=29760 RepID=D7TXK7_VITVI